MYIVLEYCVIRPPARPPMMPPNPKSCHEYVCRSWLPLFASRLDYITMRPSTTTSMNALDKFIKKPRAHMKYGSWNFRSAMAHDVTN